MFQADETVQGSVRRCASEQAQRAIDDLQSNINVDAVRCWTSGGIRGLKAERVSAAARKRDSAGASAPVSAPASAPDQTSI